MNKENKNIEQELRGLEFELLCRKKVMLTTEEWIEHHDQINSNQDDCEDFCPDKEIKGEINQCKTFLNRSDDEEYDFNYLVWSAVKALENHSKNIKPKRKRGRPKKINTPQKKRGRPKKI